MSGFHPMRNFQPALRLLMRNVAFVADEPDLILQSIHLLLLLIGQWVLRLQLLKLAYEFRQISGCA
jgi:hypothetical protein